MNSFFHGWLQCLEGIENKTTSFEKQGNQIVWKTRTPAKKQAVAKSKLNASYQFDR